MHKRLYLILLAGIFSCATPRVEASDYGYQSSRSSAYVVLDGLYNGEKVQLPSWLLEGVSDLNTQLRAKLSPSDYLEILKGELYLYNEFEVHNKHAYESNKTAHQYKWAVPTPIISKQEFLNNLRAKLGEILANPDDDNVFTRPHFVKAPKKGVIFREYIRYSSDYLVFSDEDYILGKRRGLSMGDSGLMIFWDAKTGLIKSQLAVQSCISEYGKSILAKRSGNGNIYLFTHQGAESGCNDWSKAYAKSYLVDPSNESYQAFHNTPHVNQEYGRENKESGYLYRRGLPIPTFDELMDESKPPRAPWMQSKDAKVEYLHRPKMREDLGYVWENGTSHHEINLALDTLAISVHPQSQDSVADRLKKVENTIRESMFPSPLDANDFVIDNMDIGAEENGYVLFVRRTEHYDEGTDWHPFMFGICTPDKKTYFFSRPENDVEGDLPHIGRLKPYNEIVQPLRISKSMEHDFLQQRPGWPYVIVDDNKVSLQNIPNDYLNPLYGNGPYMRVMETHLSEDKRLLELFVVANLSENNESVYIIHLDLGDYSYNVKKEWKLSRNHKLAPVWIANKRILLKPESDFQYSIIQVQEDWSEHKLADLFVESPQRYAIVLADGRYAGSPGCEGILEFGDGERVIGMKALAPWRNRPAEVLEALGGNPDDIVSLRETTKRWLRKQGFDPENMLAEPSLDNFPVAEVSMPDLFSPRERLSFRVKVKATARDIHKVIVRSDGVLIPQNWDDGFEVAAGEEKEVTVEVPLACGQNWIEVTPVDSEGISGDTTRFRTIYKGNYPSDMFIVALGVSDYDDPDLKLQYAAKDAKDIAAAFEKYGIGRKHVLVLTDKEVKDRSVLEKVKIFLSAASLEDRIVFYVAGHGMLDDKLNYYYAPASFDAEKIVETGIPMEELTGCLHNSKARHRLLLLDTCHSGVLGEEGEDKLAMSGVQLPHGVRAIQHRGMKVKKTVGVLNANQKKRYIEDMFSQGDSERGINIIAGAAGAEYALESDSWNNGVFTASVISALSGEGAARDIDGDGFFSVEELQQRISAAVQHQTGGRQKPSIVSAEGAENMVLSEGVGYVKIKKLIENDSWNELEDVINRSPRNYDAGQSEELIQEVIRKNAPLRLIKQMLEHGASPSRHYKEALAVFLNSDNAEYKSSKEEMVQMFARCGSIKTKEDREYAGLYSPADSGEEKLVSLLIEKGFVSFVNPYAAKRSLELYRVFAAYGISPNYKSWVGERDMDGVVHIKRNILLEKMRREGRNVYIQIALQSKTTDLIVSPLHELVAVYSEAMSNSDRSDVLAKMELILKNNADPNSLEGHREDGYVNDSATHITPLYVLCRHPRFSFKQALPAIKLLLKHGADIHLADCNGKEPLDSNDPNYQVLVQMAEAAKAGRSLDAFDTQVRDNSSANSSYSGATEDRSGLDPLIARMQALRCREADSKLYQKRLLTLLPLIRNGADVNVTLPETKGNTALHYSCAIGSWSITQWLVEHGADVNAVTNAGKTPLDCVGADNAKRIRELLISRGAKRSAELSSVSTGANNYTAYEEEQSADELNQIGLAYQYGNNGKPQNYSEAARHYRLAAEQGHAGAQNNLGFCYHNGWGVPKDMSQAAMWYKRSADQGNAWGQSNYGTCLEFGWGVKKNLSAAIEMYRKAAAQGHASAKKHLKRHGVTM